MSARLVVLVSGGGTNLQAILDACASGRLDASVVAVFSDRAGAFGLERARRADVPAIHAPYSPFSTKRGGAGRAAYDAALAVRVEAMRPDLVVLAGFMRILSPAFVGRFSGRLINLHPALPGAFPGTRAIERALAAAQAGDLHETGVMVHHVIPEVDAGPVIAQATVPVAASDTLDSLAPRIHAVEHELLVTAIAQLVHSRGRTTSKELS